MLPKALRPPLAGSVARFRRVVRLGLPVLAVLFPAVCAWQPAGAVSPSASLWYDGLSGFTRCSFTRHAILRNKGGVTLTPAVQYWTLPADMKFSACPATSGIDIGMRGSAREVATIWQKIIQPGRDLEYARQSPGNGVLYRDNPRTKKREGLDGFPGLSGGTASAVGWGTMRGKAECLDTAEGPVSGGISVFEGKPVMWGGVLSSLDPGSSWVASFSASARHDGTKAAYLSFDCYEQKSGASAGSFTADEADLAGFDASSFGSFAWFTFPLDMAGKPAGSRWSFRAVSRGGLESHCTVLGPVYVTATEGSLESPVFDSLSPLTSWERIEWEMDQNYGAADPSCICATPGSPLTPVVIRFGVADTPEPGTAIIPPLPLADASDYAVPAQATGRYFKFLAILHGRDTASAVLPSLAPGDANRHFSGWKPAIKRMAVRYRPKAARIVSKRIAPASLKKWGRVKYEVITPGNSRVRVDIIAPDGTVLFSDVPDAFDLGKALDPYANTAVMLRADIIGSPDVPEDRPAILWWRLDWTPLKERVQLNRTAISLGAREQIWGLASVEVRGRVVVKVHDPSGQAVATIMDSRLEVPEAATFRWDGRDRDGANAKPGFYFITVTTPRGAGTRKVEVKP